MLGAGAAGLAVANGLAISGSGAEVVLIDRQSHHFYQPGFTSVMFDDAGIADIRRPLSELVAPQIEFRNGEVTAIRPQSSTVEGDFGDLEYDYLVVALGVSLEPVAPEGCAPWSPEGAVECKDRLRGLGRGDRVLVTVAGLPYRCPPAPFDLAVRVRKTTGAEVTVSHPWARPLLPFGTGPMTMMERAFDRAGVTYLGGTVPAPETDLTIEVPAHRPPPVLDDSGLTHESGWMEVELPSLRHPTHRNVFGVGDVVAAPLNLGMAGTLGVFEAGHVAAQISSEISGHSYEGLPRLEAICFMHLGDTGSLMHCDFSPVADGGAPSCVVMPELPYFIKARSVFAGEWFDSLVMGGIR